MSKFSITHFAEESVRNNGDKADAALPIAIDGRNINCSVIGIDSPGIDDNSIALVAAMHALMEQQFKIANTIYDELVKSGRLKSTFSSKVIAYDEQHEDEADNPNEDDALKQDLAKKFLNGLTDLMEQMFGGDNNAHDD